MPDKATIERARRDAREGKSPSTQAGEFVRAEIDKVRHGEHGVRNTKQAIAIGLSEARRAGVKLPPPKKGRTSRSTRKEAQRDYKRGQKNPNGKPSARRSRARVKTLKRESRQPVSHRALSRQAKQAARKRGPQSRHGASKKAARTRQRRRR